MTHPNRSDALVGCLLGMAAGDSVGLPCEGLSRARQTRLFPGLDGQRLLLGRGMVSDDTEHAIMTAVALLDAGGDSDRFARRLAGQLRGWLLGLPAATGLATLRACMKLCVGISPHRSGVSSAGNGPAMRAPLLGVFAAELDQVRALVRISTRLTHTDPRAEDGALAVALAARLAAGLLGEDRSPECYLVLLRELLAPREPTLLALLADAAASAARGEDTITFADSLGLGHGVSGFIDHTVPVALHAWFRHPRDVRAGVLGVIRCGGDTDTTGAIAGGILGAGTGPAGLPTDWLDRLADRPRTVAWMTTLARRLAGDDVRIPAVFPPALLLRNLVFLLIILAHGFRRLLPPY